MLMLAMICGAAWMKMSNSFIAEAVVWPSFSERRESSGGTLKASLASLAMQHERIGDVRGRGLFLGVEFVNDRQTREPAPDVARYVANRCAELGVLLSTDGPDHNVIKFKPPMVFSDADADWFVSTLRKVSRELG